MTSWKPVCLFFFLLALHNFSELPKMSGRTRTIFIKKENVAIACSLGSLRHHDSHGDENVTSKYKFELF